MGTREHDIFDDLYELLFAEDEEEVKERLRRKRQSSAAPNYATYNYLNNELKRQQLIDLLFTKKLSNLESDPRVDGILSRAKQSQHLAKEKILRELLKTDSPLKINLISLYNKAFL